eukprot:gnl/TRDRNA2_/TRDRNA2_62600_c0_seq1.p1 gnl/TRDRNA2_/TRDRNA2_62600_c0~~gnl/TRDRNA2_/TRDRNA2_62600_c0_seq1.p1  ORF type:complete len:311 (+),score=65.25 gnl/TRDRNA2_/TRDRNA2_62600_c0_seq1:76-933(+)
MAAIDDTVAWPVKAAGPLDACELVLANVPTPGRQRGRRGGTGRGGVLGATTPTDASKESAAPLPATSLVLSPQANMCVGSGSQPGVSYRQQLRASGQQALQRCYDRGLTPKPCSGISLDGTPPNSANATGAYNAGMGFGMGNMTTPTQPPMAPTPYMAMSGPSPSMQAQSVMSWQTQYQQAGGMSPMLSSPFGPDAQMFVASNPFCFERPQELMQQMPPAVTVPMLQPTQAAPGTVQQQQPGQMDMTHVNMMAVAMPQAANNNLDSNEIAAQLQAAANACDCYED